MPNRLANESSPYLLQHAENPVDWYPWGQEALDKSKAENKPIFLSIGYSACHWCHVMEHESFENAVIAQFLNENFISIKVDREERPDLDQVYMQAVMALQRGQGGWPLSAFLTPDRHVFFGGTYWPPNDARGMPGFDRVLRGVLDAFQNRRDQVDEQSSKVTEYLNSKTNSAPSTTPSFNADSLRSAGASLERIFDHENGGFGQAPKFPHSMDLQVLMRLHFAESSSIESRAPGELPEAESRWMKMVNLNLQKMALGGIYDHLAGGFARYSVDEKWLVPHFEKMLYDNALLTDAYLDAYTITRNELFRQRAEETFNYQLEYMTDKEGAFHSTEDADSEGEEGKFYVWTPDEIQEILGEEWGETFCRTYGVTASGNFEGKNILNLQQPLEQLAAANGEPENFLKAIKSARTSLLETRDQRIRPGIDDKILVSWNGMMIHSMAKGSIILSNPAYLDAAVAAAEFIDSRMRLDNSVGLYHTCRHGQPKIMAYLDDYACFVQALLTLFEATADPKWLIRAEELTEYVIEQFLDTKEGGFFFSARSSEQLIAQTKDFQDSSVPSGNSMMVTVLARLYRFTENKKYRDLAESTAGLGQDLMERAPSAAGQLICGMDSLYSAGQEVVIAAHRGEELDSLLHLVFNDYHPNRAVVTLDPDGPKPPVAGSLISSKERLNDEPTVYVCEGYQCRSPLIGMESIRQHFQRR